jgi:diguanylate cyclase (GGDEF)-like protein
MRWLKLSRVAVWIYGLMGFFLLMLAMATAGLLWAARQSDLTNSEAQALRFISSAEAALNRNLLGVDMLLASMDELLSLSSSQPDWIVAPSASRLMQGAVQQSAMVRFVALVDSQGRMIASSDASGATLALSLPPGFVDDVLAQLVSTMRVSAPVVSFASAERVLYFARHIKLANSSRVVAVAEVQVPFLTTLMTQGVDITALEVTLERSNGELLASAPPSAQLPGQELKSALAGPPSDTALRMPARISGIEALVVTRPTLYRDVLITASIPVDAALENWHVQRQFIVGAALIFALMILGAGGFAVWYVDRLAGARRDIARSKATLDQALSSMVSGFVLLNAGNQVVNWNRRFEEIFPWSAGNLAPLMPFREVLMQASSAHVAHGTQTERQQWVSERLALQLNPLVPHEQIQPDGRFIQITERRTPDGGLVIAYHDVTELRRAGAEIEQLAFYDALTHLPNRRLLMDRLQQAMAASSRNGLHGALLFLDLDHFKTLNDTLGHDLGDLLLQQVGQRLKACVREEDTVARLGGDEFVVMLLDLSAHGLESVTLARRIAEKILARLNEPYQLTTFTHQSTPSIGATLFLGTQHAPAELLKQADIAMYEVKESGRNALCFFDPQMQATITARVQMEQDLKTALTQGQFSLYYQPQFEHQGALVGAEVLIRWHHPVRGMVPPIEFIALAEESDLILSIGHWVLRTACQQLALWQQDISTRDLHLSVNVSARQFRQHTFATQVAEVIKETGINARLLKLELTESVVLDNMDDTIAKMTELKTTGVRFSMDDFGTGYSSLAYLTRLPMDQLKIDQSFVRNIGIQHSDGVIVQTIIGMARNLALEVIAEGVETAAQHEFLAQHGCYLYQGYLFGKPTPLAEFEALLSTQTT